MDKKQKQKVETTNDASGVALYLNLVLSNFMLINLLLLLFFFKLYLIDR